MFLLPQVICVTNKMYVYKRYIFFRKNRLGLTLCRLGLTNTLGGKKVSNSQYDTRYVSKTGSHIIRLTIVRFVKESFDIPYQN